MNGSTWKIQYGDQSSASGIVGTDVVNLGGLTIKDQAIELASNVSAQFVESPGDGLLGLAMGSINTVEPQPVTTPGTHPFLSTYLPRQKLTHEQLAT